MCAAQVIVNLPDPLAETDPVEYMQYVQILTEDVPRMLLVHGSGREIISNFNTVVTENYEDDDEDELDEMDADMDMHQDNEMQHHTNRPRIHQD